MEKGYSGPPYRPISELYRERFGGKVYKIPVATAEACPNRLGLKGMKTCSFCDVWGSAARVEAFDLELKEQIERFMKRIGDRFKADQFLVYFQAYTSTFAALPKLRQQFDLALTYPQVKGLVVGTRPDCVSEAVMNTWNEYNEKTFVAVEMGVQTFDEDQLLFLRRGHTAADSIKSLHKIAEKTNVDLGIHLMFGMPGETDAWMKETARICNDLPITNVKLHNLHVLKNTELEKQYDLGDFSPIELEAYAERVRIFLEYLSPRFHVHRLAAFSSRFDELIAPKWTSDKMGTHQFLIKNLRLRESYQGKHYLPLDLTEKTLSENLAQRAVFHEESVKSF